MTYADTIDVHSRRADLRSRRSSQGVTEEDELLRETLRRANSSNLAPAIAHYLNAETGYSSASAASAASIFFKEWLQPPANSASTSGLMPLDTAGTLGAPDLLQHFWNAFTQLAEHREESRRSVTEERQGTEQLPGWLDAFQENLNEICGLDRDWDGHGGAPVSREACDYALKFVQALPTAAQRFELFPEPDGNVGLEYHRDETFSLYLSFSPEGTLAYVAVFRGPEGGEEVHRGDGVEVTKKIPQRIRQFLGIDA